MKKLSDGTPAKKGQIVVVLNDPLNGNKIGTITKIMDLVPEDNEAVKCSDTHVISGDPKEWFWEELDCLRVATKDESLWFKNHIKTR